MQGMLFVISCYFMYLLKTFNLNYIKSNQKTIVNWKAVKMGRIPKAKRERAMIRLKKEKGQIINSTTRKTFF